MIIGNKQVIPQNPFKKIFEEQLKIIEGLKQGKSFEKIKEENPEIKFVKFDENGKIQDLPLTEDFVETAKTVVK